MVAPRRIAAELLKKRKENKSREKNITLNNASLQVLGSNCNGHQPALLVRTEGNSYLFNCSEGTQRNCYSNRIRLTKLEHLFITETNWSKVSGAYGLSLTLQDIGIPSFTLHSTEAFSDFFKATESFLSFYTGMECKTNVLTQREHIDSSIHVRCIPLDSEPTDHRCDDRDNEQIAPKRLKRAPTLLAYHCSLPDLPGPLDPQRCRELKVPIGPKLALLKSGMDVTLEDGTVIKSQDVCGPINIGSNFIIIDCPNKDRIHSIANNHDLVELRRKRTSNNERQMDLVIHFSPNDVIDDSGYKQWMDGFPDECKHILLNDLNPKRPNFLDSYRLQYLLRQLDENIFPKLYLPDKLVEQVQSELKESTDSCANNHIPDTDEAELKYLLGGELQDMARIIEASAFDRFHLRPNKMFEFVEPKMSIDSTYKNAKSNNNFDKALASYKEVTKNQTSPEAHEPEVVFLGTGSALPSKLRNTSCILLNFWVPKRASIILDCGENSYGQLIRHYGPEGTKEILRNLKLIYISHHHADHQIGLIEILRHRKQINPNEPVQLLIPPFIGLHLKYYDENFDDLSSSYTVINTRDLKTSPTSASMNVASNSLKASLYKSLDGLLDDIVIVGVDHCAHSCAVVMKFNIRRPGMSSFKLAYSGDARPSENFAIVGQNCDVLIHEATFDHKEQNAAIEKKHSTTVEAIKVAKKMRAKFTILTHFSQRYSKIPYFTEEFDETIGFAFDNMAVRCPTHLVRLPLMKDLLKIVFAKALYEIDAKHDKVEAKKQVVNAFQDRS